MMFLFLCMLSVILLDVSGILSNDPAAANIIFSREKAAQLNFGREVSPELLASKVEDYIFSSKKGVK